MLEITDKVLKSGEMHFSTYKLPEHFCKFNIVNMVERVMVPKMLSKHHAMVVGASPPCVISLY